MKGLNSNNAKRILILGGSHRDIPLIKASQALGYFVITLGDRDYYLGHQYSDKYYKVNFNDSHAVKTIFRDENIDFILPGCGEESYLKAVELSHEFKIGHFDSLETAKLVHNKWKFKEFCLKNKICTPSGFYYNNDSQIQKISYPIVVKPTSLSGGRGVNIVNNEDELKLALNNAQGLSEEVFLEEYIEGKLIAYSIVLRNQKVYYSFTASDDVYLNKYLITTAYPIKLEPLVSEKLQKDVEKLASLLNLVNGMFHLQVLIKKDTPYIIDVTRRIPGDFFPNLIELCDEVEYSKAVVRSYTTGQIGTEFISKTQNQDFIVRHCVMPSKNGIYEDIFIHDDLIDKVISRFDLIHAGRKISNYLNTQVSILFLKFNSDGIDKEHLKNINKLIYPIVKKWISVFLKQYIHTKLNRLLGFYNKALLTKLIILHCRN
ncbi:ATP-grasp domain-containing protein [Psychromonas sp. KJ10-10]|uniref:ATP-grasp domain-containing protein n=1 Tax=Psychromonas sp. KJ10-10 TaxID=3391823 RepID=UPI0039B5DF08